VVENNHHQSTKDFYFQVILSLFVIDPHADFFILGFCMEFNKRLKLINYPLFQAGDTFKKYIKNRIYPIEYRG
jgi:hypothetical protein